MEKGQQSENAKEAYREQLTKTNNSQTLHYSTNFPQLNDVSKKYIFEKWWWINYAPVWWFAPGKRYHTNSGPPAGIEPVSRSMLWPSCWRTNSCWVLDLTLRVGVYSRIDFHYHYCYLIPIFKQSDWSVGQTKLIWLAERLIKVVVAVGEVKSEPLYYFVLNTIFWNTV